MNTDFEEGGCLCSAVRYRVSGEPRARTSCHCRSCRLACGAPSLAWTVFGSDDFTLIKGVPASFESSPGVMRGFCARCGTSLTYSSTSRPAWIDVTTATLDRADRFAPTCEIWTSHKLDFEPLNPDLPHFPASSKKAPIATP